MSAELAAEFARVAEEQIPAFIRQSADLWPDVSAKIQTQATQEAESWAQAFGAMFTIDENTPKEVIAVLAGIPRDRASDLETELAARFEAFWSQLPALVQEVSDKEAVCAKWRISDGLAHITAFLSSGPSYRYVPLYLPKDGAQRELAAKVLSPEQAAQIQGLFEESKAAALAALPALVRSAQVDERVTEKANLG